MRFEKITCALDWLYSKRAREPRSSLQPLINAAGELGNPHRQLRCLQVAGTNGKGSVCHKIARAFHASGLRAGLFTSPHLDVFEERICVDLDLIKSEEVLNELNELLAKLSLHSLQALGFFDLTLLMALAHFKKKGVCFAILEVGIGGRLDATSICQPMMTAITSIGFDHQQMLGTSKREIASEKGGIIRPNIPLILGSQAVDLGLEEMAQKVNAPVFSIEEVDLPFDEINKCVAEKILVLLTNSFPLSKANIEKSLIFRPPGRFEVIKSFNHAATWPGKLIIDVAHNEQAFEKLVEMMLIQKFSRPLHVIFGLSRSKSLSRCLKKVQRLGPDRLFPQKLKSIPSHSRRDIGAEAGLLKIPLGKKEPRISILSSAMLKAETLLICGSFHLAAEMRHEIRSNGFS